jgi:signal peptide peptidase SppA
MKTDRPNIVTSGRAHQLVHVANRVLGVPLLIEQRKLEVILSVLGDRIGIQAVSYGYDAEPARDPLGASNGVAVIPVIGTTVHRAGDLDALSGLVSYETLAQAFARAMADPAVKAVAFDLDSGGGEVSGCFDFVDQVYAARGKKPIYALINETACSAAYAIASAADRIVMARTGATGSVGVIAVHVDVTKRDEMAGVSYTLIRSGERKAEGNSHEPLSDTARTAMQAMVDRAAGLFFETVARNRRGRVTARQLEQLQGAVVFGEAALAAGLIDEIASIPDTLEAMASDPAALTRPGKSAQRMGDSNLAANLAAKLRGTGTMSTLAERLNAVIAGQVTAERSRDAILADITAAMEAAGVQGPTLDQVLSGQAAVEGGSECLKAIAGALKVSVEHITKPAAATTPAPTPAADNVAQIDKARRDAMAVATEITELCAIAGRPELAAEYLKAGLTVAQVRGKLVEIRAASGGPDISTQHAPQDRKDHGWDAAMQKAGVKLKT